VKTYSYDEIFFDDPYNDDNVLMSIPPEIVEALGLEEGSQIEIELRNNEVVLRAVRNKDGR
jgi:AbrB family looped-hinge helix DNA binding protein